MKQSKTLMVVGAHHDDVELNAGTIVRHVAAGWRVVALVATNGRWTPQGVSADNIEIRNRESLAAARLLGMETVFLGFDEGHFDDTPAARDAMTAAIRRYAPSVLVTHPPLDYHADHMAVSRCTADAWQRCTNPTFDCGEPAMKELPGFYYCDAWFEHFEPDCYVDVGEHIQVKKDALTCHASQLGPGGPAPGDMIDMEMARARYRGIQAGTEYAEAFRLVSRLGTRRASALLGEP